MIYTIPSPTIMKKSSIIGLSQKCYIILLHFSLTPHNRKGIQEEKVKKILYWLSEFSEISYHYLGPNKFIFYHQRFGFEWTSY